MTAANEQAAGCTTTATAQGKRANPHFTSRSTATEAQIARLIDLLRLAPRTTHELRCHGISHPAGRIHDLSKRGYFIDSTRVTTVDSDSFTHVGVARYILLSEPAPALLREQVPLWSRA